MIKWTHSPIHFDCTHGTHIVTAAVYKREHLLKTSDHLNCVQTHLFEKATLYKWKLHAWAIMANHYHFIASPVEIKHSLMELITKFHSESAIDLNKIDGTPGRKVWFQYWETLLTFQKSYLARLHYVQQNPVKHGIVSRAVDYPWCSAAYFEATATEGIKSTLNKFKIDQLNIFDDF